MWSSFIFTLHSDQRPNWKWKQQVPVHESYLPWERSNAWTNHNVESTTSCQQGIVYQCANNIGRVKYR